MKAALALLVTVSVLLACSGGRAAAPTCRVTEEELDAAMAGVFRSTGLTAEQLDEELHRRGLSLAQYRSDTRREMERLKCHRQRRKDAVSARRAGSRRRRSGRSGSRG